MTEEQQAKCKHVVAADGSGMMTEAELLVRLGEWERDGVLEEANDMCVRFDFCPKCGKGLEKEKRVEDEPEEKP